MFADLSCEDARMADASAEWSDLRVLLALSRAGSMVAAAKQLGVEHTTISRRIGALEKALGVRLIGRARTGVTLTDAGREAVRAAEDMERAHQSLVRRVAHSTCTPEGRVRVSMADGLVPFVVTRLPELAARHPAVEVAVHTTPATVNLEAGEADVALRHVRPTQPSLVARRISEVGWSLYASSDYITRRGAPTDPGALEGHDVIGFDASLERTPGALWMNERDRGGRVIARVNTIGSAVALMAAGQGLGIVPCMCADGLSRLTPEVLASNELYVVVHEEQQDVPRVRAVLDHLVATLCEEKARFEGRVSCASEKRSAPGAVDSGT
jgi:molybdate transport repressor ModE-like protein